MQSESTRKGWEKLSISRQEQISTITSLASLRTLEISADELGAVTGLLRGVFPDAQVDVWVDQSGRGYIALTPHLEGL